MGSKAEERELVLRILEGRPNAYSELVKRYRRLVGYIIGRMIWHPNDQDELIQEVFFRIYKYLPKFRFESSLATWITRITYTTCSNANRKKKSIYWEEQHQVHKKSIEAEIVTNTPQPDQTVLNQERKVILQKAIDQLPPLFRKIIVFYHLEELSYKDIGEILKIPEGSIKGYMFRARKLLKNYLLTNYPEEVK